MVVSGSWCWLGCVQVLYVLVVVLCVVVRLPLTTSDPSPSFPPPPSLSLSIEPPAIVIAPPDTDVNINDTVLFTCIAHGYPPPNITWLFGDDSLYNDSETVIVTNQLIENGVYFTQSILQLCGVTVDEREGQYTCVATNFLNSSQSSFYLNILGE